MMNFKGSGSAVASQQWELHTNNKLENNTCGGRQGGTERLCFLTNKRTGVDVVNGPTGPIIHHGSAAQRSSPRIAPMPAGLHFLCFPFDQRREETSVNTHREEERC